MKQLTRIRLYCGIQFDNEGQPVDQGAVEKVREYITASFGGATFTKGQGTWKDPATRQIVAEDCMIIEVIADPEDTSREFIDMAARTVRVILKQSAVLLTVEPGIFGEFV